MSKSPEEGAIWEWRAFGRLDEEFISRIKRYPIRMGNSDLRGEDLYLISPTNDQNVKLRRYSSGWLLKFKFLIEQLPNAFERYNESAEFTYRFPVSVTVVESTARLLEVQHPDISGSGSFSDSAFVDAIRNSSPAVQETKVKKRRSQYQCDGGWIELADVEFAKCDLQSISIHSVDLKIVRRLREVLDIGTEVESMSYIQACRRWG